ncbi:MAG TPA: hypothetical protein VGE74_03555, partial [Gemmata sp.]
MIVLNVAKKADITSVSFFGAAQLLLTVVTKKLRHHHQSHRALWDVTTAAPVSAKVIPGFSAHRFGELRAGDWLFGAATQNGLAAHHPATGRTIVEPTGTKPTRITLTPDGKTVLFCWSSGSRPSRDGFASRTWSGAGAFGAGFQVDTIADGDNGLSPYRCCALVVLPDGSRFLTIEWNWAYSPQLVVRSVSTGDALTVASIDGREAPSLALAPDGVRVVVAVLGSLYVFPLGSTLTPQQHIKNTGRKHFTGIAFHPSGRYLAATSNDATVKLYDTTTWEVARTVTWDIGRMRSIAFS